LNNISADIGAVVALNGDIRATRSAASRTTVRIEPTVWKESKWHASVTAAIC